MPSDPTSPLQVTFTPEFKRNLRQLAKKYRHIKSDLEPILDQLAAGSRPGDQVPQVRYEVFKVRAKNSDALRGKSGGCRLIYWAKSASEVVLVTVYSKTEQADIAPEDIRGIILDAEASPAPDAAPEQPANGAGPGAATDPPRD
jgi:mRNA-degrading endonuclease RelE of RelBE toxin-antitoxin system